MGLAGAGDLEVTGLSGRNKVYGVADRPGRAALRGARGDGRRRADGRGRSGRASSPATSSTSATPPPGTDCRCCAPCSRSSTTIPTRWRGWPRPCCHDATGGGCQIRRRARDHGDVTEELHFEDWGATYGSPYLIEDDAPGEDAELAEPVEPFTQHARGARAARAGVRRRRAPGRGARLPPRRGRAARARGRRRARVRRRRRACEPGGRVRAAAHPPHAHPRLRAAGEAGAHARVRLGVACDRLGRLRRPDPGPSAPACARPRRGWPSNSRPRAG